MSNDLSIALIFLCFIAVCLAFFSLIGLMFKAIRRKAFITFLVSCIVIPVALLAVHIDQEYRATDAGFENYAEYQAAKDVYIDNGKDWALYKAEQEKLSETGKIISDWGFHVTPEDLIKIAREIGEQPIHSPTKEK